MPAGRPAEEVDEHRLVQPRDLADGVDPARVELVRRHPADAPQPLDGERVEERQLVARGHDEEAVRLGDAARDLGEELRPRDTDRDRSPTWSRTRRRRAAPRSPAPGQPGARAHGRRGTPRRSRALRREASFLEHLEHRLARLRVRRHARSHDDRLRAEPSGLPATHRGADAVRLRLVARGEHDPRADDHRAAAEPIVVPLLDRREERVDVCMQHRGLPRHEHMFARSSSRCHG